MRGALWVGTALLVFVVLHAQAYFNYFYLAGYLLLLGVVGLAADERVQTPAGPAHGPAISTENPP